MKKVYPTGDSRAILCGRLVSLRRLGGGCCGRARSMRVRSSDRSLSGPVERGMISSLPAPGAEVHIDHLSPFGRHRIHRL